MTDGPALSVHPGACAATAPRRGPTALAPAAAAGSPHTGTAPRDAAAEPAACQAKPALLSSTPPSRCQNSSNRLVRLSAIAPGLARYVALP